MRWLAMLVFAACGGPPRPRAEPAPQPEVQGVAVDEHPCPDNILEVIHPGYEAYEEKPDFRVTVCKWGKFAGPGWIVFHYTPWPEGSQAEVGPEGGIAFVDASGKLVASHDTSGYDGGLEVKVVDLDGDGDDDALVTHASNAILAPISSTVVQAVSVDGDQLVLAGYLKLSYARGMTPPFACSGKVATQPDPVKGKQIIVVMAPWKGKDDGECLSPGRHVFKLVDGDLVEQGAKAP